MSNKNFKSKIKKELDVSKYLGVNPWIKKTKMKKGRLEYIKVIIIIKTFILPLNYKLASI